MSVRNGIWKPTAGEARTLRQMALVVGKVRRVRMEPGYRVSTLDDGPVGSYFNVLLCHNEDPGTNYLENTDLGDFGEWGDFVKNGAKLTDDGRAVVDFYLSEVNEDRSMLTNLQAHFADGHLIRVTATPDDKLMERGKQEPDGTIWRREA